MPPILLLSTFLDVWNSTSPFLAAGLAVVTGWAISTLTFRREQLTKQSDEEKTWRDSRLLAEQRHKDDLASEKSERVQWQLKREAESALVAGILEESAEAQIILASIVSTTRHLEGGQTRIDQDIRELRGHIGTIQAQLLNLASLANPRHANS